MIRRRLQALARGFSLGVRGTSFAFGVGAALLMIAAVGVICQSVFVRYVMDSSTFWQTEFVTYCLIASTFLGSPYVLLTKGHVRVEMLATRMQGRARRCLRLFSEGLTVVVLAALALSAFHLFQDALANQWKSESMWGVRLWIPYGAMMIGLALLALQGLCGLLDEWQSPETSEGPAE